MTASDLIKELEQRIKLYGDLPVLLRLVIAADEGEGEICSVCADAEAGQIILTDFPDLFS